MSTTMMIGAGIVVWVLVAVLTAFVVGKILQRRDRHRPVEADPLPAETRVTGRRTKQSALRRGRR